jgi:hypothetical protein
MNAAAGPMMAEVTDPWSVYVWQGAVHPLPPKPGVWATFDPASATWLDQRNAAQRAADLELAKATAIAKVNGWAARERARHITPIPGQDMIYLAKEAEALRWLAADPAPADLIGYPLLAAEIGITAETPDQLAQLWVHLGQIWRGLAAEIETLRLGAIRAITEAGDEDGVSAALATLPNAG